MVNNERIKVNYEILTQWQLCVLSYYTEIYKCEPEKNRIYPL